MSICLRAVLVAALALALPAQAGAAPFQRAAQIAGLVREAGLAEISGLTGSSRRHDVLWVHNDSGDRAMISALGTDGRVLARVVVDDVDPVDWEDIAAFERDGKAYLLIGDVGDNGGVRDAYELVVIEEPALPDASAARIVEQHVRSAWRTRFRYTDAAHDVEALGVDGDRAEIVLVTKRTDVPQIWTVPLQAPGDAMQTARLHGNLGLPARLPPIAAGQRLRPRRPTGMAFDPRGELAAVITYHGVWLYARQRAQSWAAALAQQPRTIELALVPQAEAVGFAADGEALFVTGEHWPAVLLRLDR